GLAERAVAARVSERRPRGQVGVAQAAEHLEQPRQLVRQMAAQLSAVRPRPARLGRPRTHREQLGVTGGQLTAARDEAETERVLRPEGGAGVPQEMVRRTGRGPGQLGRAGGLEELERLLPHVGGQCLQRREHRPRLCQLRPVPTRCRNEPTARRYRSGSIRSRQRWSAPSNTTNSARAPRRSAMARASSGGAPGSHPPASTSTGTPGGTAAQALTGAMSSTYGSTKRATVARLK